MALLGLAIDTSATATINASSGATVGSFSQSGGILRAAISLTNLATGAATVTFGLTNLTTGAVVTAPGLPFAVSKASGVTRLEVTLPMVALYGSAILSGLAAAAYGITVTSSATGSTSVGAGALVIEGTSADVRGWRGSQPAPLDASAGVQVGAGVVFKTFAVANPGPNSIEVLDDLTPYKNFGVYVVLDGTTLPLGGFGTILDYDIGTSIVTTSTDISGGYDLSDGAYQVFIVAANGDRVRSVGTVDSANVTAVNGTGTSSGRVNANVQQLNGQSLGTGPQSQVDLPAFRVPGKIEAYQVVLGGGLTAEPTVIVNPGIQGTPDETIRVNTAQADDLAINLRRSSDNRVAVLRGTITATGSVVNPASPTVTFTQAAAAIGVAVPSAGDIGVYRGDTLNTSLTGLGNITGRTKLWFTVKASPTTETDAEALLQIEETAGLITVNRASASISTDASLTVSNATTGVITITVKPAATALLPTGTHTYDVQALTASGVTSLATGSLVVTADVTRATA